jgi:uncharacterized iron-regulated membrane protein
MSIGSIALRLRSILFWVHLVMGVVAGAVILVMSVTGVLLGFERQVIAAVDGAPKVAVPAGAVRLPLDTLLARVARDTAPVATLSLRRDAAEPVQVRFADRARAVVLLDPYTGAVVPRATRGRAQAFMQDLRRWHRWVGQKDPRGWGRTATGVANLVFFFIVLTGLYLWWPRRWTRAIVASLTVPAFRVSPKAREFNWHHVAGIWMAVPLAIVVGSAVFMSYEWPTQWVERLATGAAPARGTGEGGGGGPPRGTPVEGGPGGPRGAGRRAAAPQGAASAAPTAPLEPALQIALAKRPDWESVSLALPSAGERSITAQLASGNTFRPDLRTTVIFDGSSGAVQRVTDYADLPFGRRVRGWIRFAHTGEVLGLTGQVIATLASFAGVLLVYTGIALSLRRFAAWRGRRTRDAAAA